MGRYVYLYESTSYWDPKSKCPRNRKESIGMIDPVTGDKYFKQGYIDRLQREGKPTGGMKVWIDKRKSAPLGSISGMDTFTPAQEILGTVKNFGLAYFLQSVAEDIGLVGILKEAVPRCWQKVLVLACYLVAEDKPTMYCSDWVEENDYPDIGNMSSQRISELLCVFGYNERTVFFKLWYRHIREREYIALDITSVSSYSENIETLGWGHNRDNERLPQLNICMLYGAQSKMPVYQSIYSGSLTDVTTLETTLDEFEAITGTRDIMLIMDKGFYSAKNVKHLLGNTKRLTYRFLIPVSFTANFAIDHIKNERANIDDVDNIILTSGYGMPVRGIHRLSDWNNNIRLHTHIYYDPESALRQRNDMYEYLARLKKSALQGDNDPKLQKGFQKYLIINKVNGSGVPASVRFRKEAVEKSLEHSGWLILISNDIEDTQEALDLYRAKDVVEKSFFQYKNNLGLNRLHVHSDERALNKTFIAFIALIISSHIRKVMKDKGLDDIFPFGKLLGTLSKLKIAYVSHVPVLQPLTKDQKLIFKSFSIKLPSAIDE
jgi:hypothetical protein